MKVNKCKKLVCNLHDKKDYVDYIRSLKQALNYGLKRFIKYQNLINELGLKNILI